MSRYRFNSPTGGASSQSAETGESDSVDAPTTNAIVDPGAGPTDYSVPVESSSQEEELRSRSSDRHAATSSQSDRYNLRTQMRNAVEASERLITASRQSDVSGMGIAGTELIDALYKAAKYKAVRDRHWFQGLTIVHGALANCDLDRVTVETAEGINECMMTLAHSGYDRSDLQNLKRVLKQIGIDPWATLSPKTEEPGEDKIGNAE